MRSVKANGGDKQQRLESRSQDGPEARGRRRPRERHRAWYSVAGARGRHDVGDLDRLSRAATVLSGGRQGLRGQFIPRSNSPSSAPRCARPSRSCGRGADGHRAGHLRHRHEYQRELHRVRPDRSEPGGCRSVLEVRAVEQVRGRLLHSSGKTYGLPLMEGSKRFDVLQQGDVQARPASPGRRDLRRADRCREEAGEVRRLRQDDAQRHQPAPVGPGQRHHREVPLSCSRPPAPP